MRLPFGELPGSVYVNIATVDTFAHGWDLAKATGQSTDLDPELAAKLLAFSQVALPDAFRGPDGEAPFGRQASVSGGGASDGRPVGRLPGTTGLRLEVSSPGLRGVEAQWEAGRSPDPEGRGLPFDSAGQGQVGQAPGQDRERFLQLGSGQGRSHAEVDARAERHLRGAPLLGDVEGLGLLPCFGVSVGSGQRRGDEGALREEDVPVDDVLRGEASRCPGRRRGSASTPRRPVGRARGARRATPTGRGAR